MSEVFNIPLGNNLIFLFLLLIFLILLFELINGFHDTANAVATIIYSNSMRPLYSVLISGLFNFIGVLSGGLAVAYSIVHLLPINLLSFSNNYHLIAMIFSIIIGAISWNFITWYFGIPASSSHTLIGSIIGVAICNAWINNTSIYENVNWNKAIDIVLSLLLSPLFGFILAYFLFIFLVRLLPRANIHGTPENRLGTSGKKHPPFWTRFFLIISSIGVSFAHGSNDGQKGVGLFMLALICFLPGKFSLNDKIDRYQLERTVIASSQLNTFIKEKRINLDNKIINNIHNCSLNNINIINEEIKNILITNKYNIKKMHYSDKMLIRNNLACLQSVIKKIQDNDIKSPQDKKYLSKINSDIILPIEYAPIWVIISIGFALSIGTLFGWKRVVKTMGENIGNKNMTYSQGLCSQLITAFSIVSANVFGLPVSTTQILSSAIAGTAVANKSGLNFSTIKYILLTWVLTLPVSILISATFYYIIVNSINIF